LDKNNFKLGELFREEFNEKQWNEILTGVISGCDVLIYAKSNYHYTQMRELRLGQEAGIDTTCYEDRFLHSKDMAIIRKAIEQEYKYDILLDREFNHKQREQIYLGMISGVSYMKYALPIHNEWKMMEVRLGFEKGIDLTQYLFTHNHNQIHQIRIGIENGLSVKIFDDNRFKQAQMAEIIDGMLRGLDVSQYTDYNLSIEQMRSKKAELILRETKQSKYKKGNRCDYEK
jgi:hypothetical protein